MALEVCYGYPKNQVLVPGDINEIEAWCGQKLGEFRGVKVIDKGVRILSYVGGFAVFLPKQVWRPLDYEIDLYFPKKKSSCWIAGEDFAYLKVDYSLSNLKEENKDYASADLDIVLNKVEAFVRKNFFENKQARPGNLLFTQGSFYDNPDKPCPARSGLREDFYFQF